jgi:hypothetical protein
MLRKLSLIIALLTGILAICALSRSVTHVGAQNVPPVERACCGKKPPKFRDLPATPTMPAQTYSTFTGQMAIVTGELKGGSSVIAVDLKNENGGVPLDQNWNDSSSVPPTHFYRHSDWATSKIGTVFGLTLDNQGNVYVTASTSYLIDFLPAGATGGEVYRIDGNSGTVSKFATLPNKGPALGNIEFSCKHGTFFVTNFADGRIYQMVVDNTTSPPTGKVISTFSHATGTIATGFISKNGDPEPGRDYLQFVPKNPQPGSKNWGRLWGVKVLDDRLYYGVWRQDTGTGANSQPNEVWSVKLTPGGAFVAGSAQLEIKLPTLQSTNPTTIPKNFSNPVSSISFNANGDMLLSERGMNGDSNSPTIAYHEARLLEYTRPNTSSAWTPLTTATANKFGVGSPHLFATGIGSRPSSAGGADYDTAGGLVWSTADAMHFPNYPLAPDPQTPKNTDYLYGIQGLPMIGGTIHNSILVDLTDTITNSNKNEMGDVELPCVACTAGPTPTPPPAECCDKISAVPYPQQNVSLDYRTFTITNLKAPQSPICSVDISMTPTPSTGWQGGDLYINGILVPTATRFISPYTRIPNKGAPTISATNTVMFNLGVDYTIGWTGTVTFVIHHCDGSICTLTYGPWSALPPSTVVGPDVFDINLSQEGMSYTLGLQLKQREWKGAPQWISFRVPDEKSQIFAASAPSGAETRGRVWAEPMVEDGGLKRNSILYKFAQPLKSRQAAAAFNLVVRREARAANTPLVIFTTYDANGNALETGTINGTGPK